MPMPKTDNAPAVQKLRDYLYLESPSDFCMERWATCIAGYACRVLSDGVPGQDHVARKARDLLGLDAATGVELFDEEILDAPHGTVTLDIAIARLDAILAGEEMAQ